jgi:low temperature requirement protein LtrA
MHRSGAHVPHTATTTGRSNPIAALRQDFTVRALRSSLVPPRLRLQEVGDREVERHATWTELFFDLVFVVCVAQLATGLHGRPTLAGAATFAALFVPVWWTWTTYAYVADLFDADDVAFRAVLLGAMLLVAAQGATIAAAFDGRTTGFGVAYAILRADLLAVYAWAWRSDPALRRLTGAHFSGFSVGLAVWLAALAFDGPARYVLWGVAIAIDLATGLVAYLRPADVPRHSSHMPERFGLFVLIVLGESVIAVSVGTADAHWALGSAATAALGFVLASALWWLYFARFDGEVFSWALAGGDQARRRSFVFGYGHLPMLAALAAVGVAVKLGIEQAIARGGHPHTAAVLGIALAAYLVSLTAVQRAAPRSLERPAVAGRCALAAGAVLLAVLGDHLGVLELVGLPAAALCAQVALETAVAP